MRNARRLLSGSCLVSCVSIVLAGCDPPVTGPEGARAPEMKPRSPSADVTATANTCGTSETVMNGFNGNDVLFFEGVVGQLTKTFVNPYSGRSVAVDATLNITSRIANGLAGIDTYFMTDVGDALCLINESGDQTLANIERIIAGDGGDVIDLSHPTIVLGDLFIDGGRGEDLIWGNANSDVLRGFDGNDDLDGGPGMDQLLGQNGDDVLYGNTDGDVLDGGLGADLLFGDGGADGLQFFADFVHASGALTANNGVPGLPGPGTTVSIGGRNGSSDVFDGGVGADILKMTDAADVLLLWDDQSPHHPAGTPLRIIGVERFDLGGGDDVLNLTHPTITYGNAVVFGEAGNDVIWTSAGDDNVNGGIGNDAIWTGPGSDIVDGGEGDDTIDVVDGVGQDQVTCGDGIDVVRADPGDTIAADCETVVLANSTPVASTGGPYTGLEGAAVTLSLGGSDPDGNTLSYTWNLGDGTTGSGAVPPSSHAYADNGTYTITLTASDGSLSHTATTTAAIGNVAPAIGAIAATLDPVATNTSIALGASFTDAGANDGPWSYIIDWGDASTPQAGTVGAQGAGALARSHAYAAAGVYGVKITVTDKDGGADTETHEFIVVYDPNVGFVTGGGWINSPPGAYSAAPLLVGKANFGFVSKYKKGQSTPDGDTEFQFQAAGLSFESISYEWLVITGSKAQFKGAGRINGGGNYGFMITATDGGTGGGADKLRVKIWDALTDAVVYDNQTGDAANADATTALGGGSVVIHRK